ncbi:MAG: AAA family ATPase [Ruminococcus sp.]|nr:AAA family ATPase [Ruminococcus sp.]
MEKYIVRIDTDYSYAKEQLGGFGNYWFALKSAFPAENNVDLFHLRFTFAVLTMTAENKEECRNIITSTVESVYPDVKDFISELFISVLGEGDTADLITTIYKNCYGTRDYIRLIRDLTDTIPLLAEKNALDMLIGQNYLIAVDEGCGFTTFVNSLGDYLHRMKIFPEEQYKDRLYYYLVKLGSETANGLTSPDDAIDALKEDKGKNSYNLVSYDITYFLEGGKLDTLRSFLKRLDDYQDNIVFAFRIPFLEKKALDEISGMISDLMTLRVIQVPPLHDSVLMETVYNVLNGRGYSMDEAVIDLVLQKINREKMDGRFYGFQTAAKVARELILSKSADVAAKESRGEQTDRSRIAPEDLSDFIAGEKEVRTGYDALTELIGMENIEKRVREIVAQVKVSMKNDKLDHPCIHMRFTGAPGTGKTTVARIIGQILREEGVLRKGGFFEYEARALVAEYVGQTAVKTASICRDAYGSVLFIDEAYSLNEGHHDSADYGKEAIATLISEMENHRDDMLVVMAGYTDEMDKLMNVNPGLRSRMPYILNFPNYTKEQLFDIFMLMVKKHFSYENELKEQAHDYFLSLSDAYLGSKEFANARFVRNLYERTWSKAALRSSLSGKEKIELTKEDFLSASGEKEFTEKLNTVKKVGFK